KVTVLPAVLNPSISGPRADGAPTKPAPQNLPSCAKSCGSKAAAVRRAATSEVCAALIDADAEVAEFPALVALVAAWLALTDASPALVTATEALDEAAVALPAASSALVEAVLACA